MFIRWCIVLTLCCCMLLLLYFCHQRLSTHCADTILTMASLAPGDIVLLSSGPTQSLFRQLCQNIMLRSFSPCTHMGIVVNNHPNTQRCLILEATVTGVRLVTLSTLIASARQQRQQCMVRKLYPPLRLHQRQHLRRLARKSIGAKYAYSVWKAVAHFWHPHLSLPSANPLTLTNWQKPMYCSELVALLLTKLGVVHFHKPLDTVLPCHFTSAYHLPLTGYYQFGEETALLTTVPRNPVPAATAASSSPGAASRTK